MPAIADQIKEQLDAAMAKFNQFPDVEAPPEPATKPDAPAADKPPEPPAAAPSTTPPQDKSAPTSASKSDTTNGLDESKWPRSAVEWKRHVEGKKAILAEKRAAEERASKLESDLKALTDKVSTQPSGPTKEDFDKLKAAHDEYQAMVRGLNLAEDPQFKSQYDNAITASINQGKGVAGEHGDRIASLLAMPASQLRDEQIEAIVAELSPLKQAQIGNVMSRLDRLREQREQAIKDARTNWEQYQGERQKLEQARATQFVNGLLDSIKTSDEFKPFLTADDYAALQRDAMTAPADEKETADRFLTMARGRAFAAVLKAAIADKEEIKKLTAEIESLKAATPKAGAGAPIASQGTPDEDQPPKGANPQELAAWFGRRVQRAYGQ